MILTKSPRVLLSLYLMMTAGSYFKPVVASAVTPFETNADLKTAVEQYCNGTFVSSSVYGWVVVGSIKPCLPTRCTSTQFVSKTASQTASKSHSTSVQRRIDPPPPPHMTPTWNGSTLNPQHDTVPLLIPNMTRFPFFIQDYTSRTQSAIQPIWTDVTIIWCVPFSFSLLLLLHILLTTTTFPPLSFSDKPKMEFFIGQLKSGMSQR